MASAGITPYKPTSCYQPQGHEPNVGSGLA